jgi:hypothetical protein
MPIPHLPNSNAVVYADSYASVILFTVIDGYIAEICRNCNPKALKFARLESETDIRAIEEDSAIYRIAIEGGSTLVTDAAFGMSILGSADCSGLAFVTESGALAVIMKCGPDLRKIFHGMKQRVNGLGNISFEDYRKVGRNGKFHQLGQFMDGNFLRLFGGLPDTKKAGVTGMIVEAIEGTIGQFVERLAASCSNTQRAFLQMSALYNRDKVL